MSFNAAFRNFSLTLDPNETRTVDISGSRFMLTRASSELTALDTAIIRFDNDEPLTFRAGQGVNGQAGESFDRIEVTNPVGATATFEFVAGFADVIDARAFATLGPPFIGAPRLSQSADTTLIAATVTSVSLASQAKVEVIIHNISAGALRVGGASVAANRGLIVQNGETLFLQTSAAVSVRSVAGGDIAVTELVREQ